MRVVHGEDGTAGRRRRHAGSPRMLPDGYHRVGGRDPGAQGASAPAALPGLRGADGQGAPQGPHPPAHRRDARRQPALGQGRRAATPPTATAPAPPTSSRCSSWCEEVGVEVVTLWLLSTDNLNRPPEQLEGLLDDHRRRGRRAGRASAAGGSTRSARSTCCPPRSPTRLKEAEEATRDVDGLLVNVAVGVRRPPRDRRRRALAAPGARRARAPASRSWPRSSTSSTSPSTSTPRASPTPTW